MAKSSGLGEVYDPLAWLDNITQPYEEGPTDAQSSHSGTTPAPDAGGKDPTDPASAGTSGSSGSYGSGYGSGSSGGSGDTGLSQYIQFYRINFFPGGTPPKSLLQKAKDNGWTTEYFAQQVRLKDPKYYKSLEARQLLPSFNRTMKVLFPGLSDKAKQAQLMKSPFYKRIALWYLKNGIGALGEAGNELLYNRITGSQRWKKNNPEYRFYAKNAAAAAESNPLLYKQLESGMRDIFKEQGVELPDDYYKSFFQSRYATEEGISALSSNLKTLSQAKPAASWFSGRELTNDETKQTLFGGKDQASLRSRLARSFNVQSSFLSADQQGFGTSMDERGKLVKRTI